MLGLAQSVISQKASTVPYPLSRFLNVKAQFSRLNHGPQSNPEINTKTQKTIAKNSIPPGVTYILLLLALQTHFNRIHLLSENLNCIHLPPAPASPVYTYIYSYVSHSGVHIELDMRSRS